MLTLHDLKAAIDRRSSEERRELLAYLDQLEAAEQKRPPQMREGTTQAELNDMTAAMNADPDE